MTIKIRVQKTYKEMQKTSLLLRMSYVKENGPFHSEPAAESLWQGNIWCKYTLIYEDYNIFLLCCKENRINKLEFLPADAKHWHNAFSEKGLHLPQNGAMIAEN